MTEAITVTPEMLRESLTATLWELKKTIPRGHPFPQWVCDAEDRLWGWKVVRVG